ncbi:hypothetical protein BYT27DRAFT_7013155, partial [Phlegmacium glaucopus]
TLLLLKWKALLERLELTIRIMLRYVKTCWNSTYDMLAFALEYKKVIEELTSDVNNGLRTFKLDEAEWVLVKEL